MDTEAELELELELERVFQGVEFQLPCCFWLANKQTIEIHMRYSSHCVYLLLVSSSSCVDAQIVWQADETRQNNRVTESERKRERTNRVELRCVGTLFAF